MVTVVLLKYKIRRPKNIMTNIEDLKYLVNITDRVLFEDGSWIGAGIIDNPKVPGNILAIRAFDKNNKMVFWADFPLGNALAITETLSGAIRKYINMTGRDQETYTPPVKKEVS